jgi:hypothetical protein
VRDIALVAVELEEITNALEAFKTARLQAMGALATSAAS